MALPEELKKYQLQLLGKGAQGTVYRIDHQRCVKVFKNPKCCARETANLKRAQHEPRFPKVYESGDNYLVREYLDGMELGLYLTKHPLTKSISLQLLELLQAFERLHFKRIDTQLRNVMITSKGKLRPIDLVNSMRMRQPYPKLLLTQLAELGFKEVFLKHVRHANPELYKKWNGNLQAFSIDQPQEFTKKPIKENVLWNQKKSRR